MRQDDSVDKLTSQTSTAHSEHSLRFAGHCGLLSPTGRGYWQKYAPQPSHCTGCRGLQGNGRGFDIEFGVGTRGEFDQDTELRLRTPETLSERGRDELTGTKDSELVRVNGSGCVVRLNEDDAANSTGAAGATRTCDRDNGVPSEDSDSLSAVETASNCDEAVGVRSMSSLVLPGLKSGITKRCGGSVCART